eukprot:gene12265-15411_t
MIEGSAPVVNGESNFPAPMMAMSTSIQEPAVPGPLGAPEVLPPSLHGDLIPNRTDSSVLKLKGLPYSATEQQIRTFFEGFSIRTVAFVLEPDGRPMPYLCKFYTNFALPSLRCWPHLPLATATGSNA